MKALKGITATISGDTSSLPVSERVKQNGSKEMVKLSPSKSVFKKKGEEEEEKEEGKEEEEKVKKKKEEKEVIVRRGSGMSVLGSEKFPHRIKQE